MKNEGCGKQQWLSVHTLGTCGESVGYKKIFFCRSCVIKHNKILKKLKLEKKEIKKC